MRSVWREAQSPVLSLGCSKQPSAAERVEEYRPVYSVIGLSICGLKARLVMHGNHYFPIISVSRTYSEICRIMTAWNTYDQSQQVISTFARCPMISVSIRLSLSAGFCRNLCYVFDTVYWCHTTWMSLFFFPQHDHFIFCCKSVRSSIWYLH